MKRHLLLLATLAFAPACSGAATSPPDAPLKGATAPTAEPAATGDTPRKAVLIPCLEDDEAGCKKKCDAGDLESCSRLASIYAFGNANVQEDLAKARALDAKACEGGLGKACYSLATAYQLGRGAPKNAKKAEELTAKAVPLMTAACEAGDGESCSHLADLHLSGTLPKDEAKEASLRARATELYGRACEAGDASACFMFGGDMLMQKKNELGARALEKGCRGGDAGSCSLLGGCYDEGVGVAPDPAKARALWAKACKGGISAACTR